MERGRSDGRRRAPAVLAPYAQQPGEGRGREHAEDEHPFRGEYARDRDRLVHSRAFRRLEYKTQVFLNGTGDHYRTRLTHTMEVASVSRTVARALQLNEDLAECIALAHDLGHAPFGHAGEQALHELMLWHGGFEHNEQSLRVVEELEIKYPEFNGLNLTWEVREGMLKHGGAAAAARTEKWWKAPGLEAQVADYADTIAYSCHDLDDGLDAGLFHLEDLRGLALWRKVDDGILAKYPRLEAARRRAFAVRCLVDRLVEDLSLASAAALRAASPANADDVRRRGLRLIGFSEAMAEELQDLRDFLFERFYHHEVVEGMNRRGAEMLARLFEVYVKNPTLMGAQTVRRIKKDGVHRAACDYLAGMTDSYARRCFGDLIGGEDVMAGLRGPTRAWGG